MVKAILRTKSIGTKVTEEEYTRLDELAAAAGQSRAEWVRTILLDRLERTAAKVTEETVLAELLGLRTILLNLLFTTAKGETMTAEQMQAAPTPANWSGRGNCSLRTFRRRRRWRAETGCSDGPLGAES